MTTSITAGSLGGALTGVIVDHAGPAWSFLLAGGAVGIAALVAAHPRAGLLPRPATA